MLISMLMIPHQPLTIEAPDRGAATLALIHRCAAALEYEVFEPECGRVKATWDALEFGDYAAAA